MWLWSHNRTTTFILSNIRLVLTAVAVRHFVWVHFWRNFTPWASSVEWKNIDFERNGRQLNGVWFAKLFYGFKNAISLIKRSEWLVQRTQNRTRKKWLSLWLKPMAVWIWLVNIMKNITRNSFRKCWTECWTQNQCISPFCTLLTYHAIFIIEQSFSANQPISSIEWIYIFIWRTRLKKT